MDFISNKQINTYIFYAIDVFFIVLIDSILNSAVVKQVFIPIFKVIIINNFVIHIIFILLTSKWMSKIADAQICMRWYL